MSILSLGLNFNIGPALDTRKMICAAENALTQVDPSCREEARTRVVGVLSMLPSHLAISSLTRQQKEAVTSLRSNPDIVVLPVDKGNETVLPDRSKYKEKMLLLLEDEGTYAKLARDPTAKLQKELQKLLADVFRMVPPQQRSLYYYLLCHNGSPPAIYGLPKIDKPDVPLRPIVDFTRSPLQNLSKFLHRVISPLVGKRPTHIRNAQDFIEKVRHLEVETGEIMVSFDVKSLFTSVPVDLAVKVCTAALESDPSLPERTPIDVPDLTRLLRFCLTNTYFTFENVPYKQIHGAAMGASICVTVANLTMEEIEGRALAAFTPAPKVFLRYVDDCFCVVKREALKDFIVQLNSIEPAIQFTVEEEIDGRLPFLDLLVTRDSSRLHFSVYRKPTHTGRYLSYRSIHPDCQKCSVVSSLLRRMKVCSRREDQAAESEHIRRDFTTCGYPVHIIDSMQRKLDRPRMQPAESTEKRTALPYVPDISDALARILRSYGVHTA
ncbi:uncharacterized protein LOC144134065 [Amblyomma americanum]